MRGEGSLVGLVIWKLGLEFQMTGEGVITEHPLFNSRSLQPHALHMGIMILSPYLL